MFREIDAINRDIPLPIDVHSVATGNEGHTQRVMTIEQCLPGRFECAGMERTLQNQAKRLIEGAVRCIRGLGREQNFHLRLGKGHFCNCYGFDCGVRLV